MVRSIINRLSKISVAEYRTLGNILNKLDLDRETLAEVTAQRKLAIAQLDYDYLKVYRRLLSELIVAMAKKRRLSRGDQESLQVSLAYLQEIWPVDFLYNRLEKVNDHDWSGFINVLDKLKDYQLGPTAVNREGTTALEILNSTKGEKLFTAINRLIQDNHFFVVEDLDALWRKYQEIDIEKSNFFLKLKQAEHFRWGHASCSGVALPLSGWTKKEFTRWRQAITIAGGSHVPEFILNNVAEVMAVLSQAVYNTVLVKIAYPRPVQFLAWFSLLNSSHGVLNQIDTSEGKTLIIAMFAAIKAIEGRWVDIITSSDDLVIRDAYQYKDFYELFNISMSHNIDRKKSGGAKECYKSDVVYGDILNFNGDGLWDITGDTKYGRWQDILILDEVDVHLIDHNNMKIQLSRMTPGFEILSQLLVYMWGNAVMSLSRLYQGEHQCFFKSPSMGEQDRFSNLTEENLAYQLQPLPGVLSCLNYVKEYLVNYTQDNLLAFKRSREKRIAIPSHLKRFAQDQLLNWIDSLFLALRYTEKVNYIVWEGLSFDSYPTIVPGKALIIPSKIPVIF